MVCSSTNRTLIHHLMPSPWADVPVSHTSGICSLDRSLLHWICETWDLPTDDDIWDACQLHTQASGDWSALLLGFGESQDAVDKAGGSHMEKTDPDAAWRGAAPSLPSSYWSLQDDAIHQTATAWETPSNISCEIASWGHPQNRGDHNMAVSSYCPILSNMNWSPAMLGARET